MARRGTFGRLPRVAPSLTGTIVAAAREMAAARDRNIVDAWQKGGMFEGAPVTDERLLAHWKTRLRNIDKKDPQWDTFNNIYMQTDYAIHESRIATRYAQGKVSETQMAAFYTNWAKKVPKNSEFYRSLQRDAAGFLKSAAAKGRAGASARAEKGFQAAQEATKAKYEATGKYLTETLTAIARARHLIGADATASDLRYFDSSDPAVIAEAMKDINTNPGHVVYVDPLTGLPVTGQDILDKVGTTDPHFSGELTIDYYGQALKQQLVGAGIRYDRAKATDHGVSDIQDEQRRIAEQGREAKVWTAIEHYSIIRDQFLKTWLDPTATHNTKLAAWRDYADDLTTLANDKKMALDDTTKASLIGEAEGNVNITNLSEDMFGFNDRGPGEDGGPRDNAQTQIDVEAWTQEAIDIATGKSYWGFDKNLEVVATSVELDPPPTGAVRVFIPQGNGEPPIAVWAVPKEIRAQVVDANGGSITATNPNAAIVGQFFDMAVGGKFVRMYSFDPASGSAPVFTRFTPWDPSKVSVSPDGSVVTVQIPVLTAENTTAMAAVGGLTVTTAEPTILADGSVSLTQPKVTVTANSAWLVLHTDEARARLGLDSTTDSPSPTIALHMTTPAGMQLLTQLSKDPDFRLQVDDELHLFSGFTLDPTTGVWGGGNQLNYLVNADKTRIQLAGGVDPERQMGPPTPIFDKEDRDGAFKAAPLPPVVNEFNSSAGVLPSESARGTQFDALARLFKSSSTKFEHPGKQADDRVIVAPTKIVLPTITPVPTLPPIVTPAPVPAPTPTPTPVVPPPPGNTPFRGFRYEPLPPPPPLRTYQPRNLPGQSGV